MSAFTPVFLQDTTPPILAIKTAKSGPIYIDFTQGKKAHRRQFGGGKNQPLARAVGLNHKSNLTLIDATAGMGGDSFVLAALGCEVTLIERAPEISALLENAIARGLICDDLEVQNIVRKMHLIHQDATIFLTQEKPQADVIYLDPMYPEKKKKAAPKKEMALLQALVGPDLDSEALLQAALNCPVARVVVKRPKGAPYINDLKPQTEITSPNTRYDVYVLKSLKE